MLHSYPARKIIKLIQKNRLAYWYYRRTKGDRTFSFDGRQFRYFFHPHNTTWVCERAVEIPIIGGDVAAVSSDRVLEVGNVLAHYFPSRHDVVDKYERAAGVRNIDVVDYRPPRQYDLIVSISTLEHVGWDEKPRDPLKAIAAVDRLKSLLSPAGRFVATLPIGYNPPLDQLIRERRLGFDSCRFLKRITSDNCWEEVDYPEVANARYHRPFLYANALMIGVATSSVPAAVPA